MQVNIEPAIRRKVDTLNETARDILERHGTSNSRLAYTLSEKLPYNQTIRLMYPDKEAGKATINSLVFNTRGTLVDRHSMELEAREAMRVLANDALFSAIEEARKTRQTNTTAEEILAQIRNAVLQEMHVKQGDSILELGPGEGHLVKEMLAKGGTITAVDDSTQLTQKLRQRFIDEILAKKLRVEKRDYADLPNAPTWRYGQFNHVVASNSTEKHAFPSKVFRIARAALKKGGKLTIVEITPFHEELRQHLERAGFEVEKVQIGKHAPGFHPLYKVPKELFYTMITARKK